MSRKNWLKRICVVAIAGVMIVSQMACGSKAPASSDSSTQAATAATATATSTAASNSSEVKLGFVWPLTGGSATIGAQHNDGANMAIAEINANGGVKSLGGAKIVPITADSESKPDIGANQTERLITKEGVCAVVGAYNSSVCVPASEVAQRYKTPWISMGGVANAVTERGYEWVFRVNNMATYDVKEMLLGIDIIAKENNAAVKTYALIYESTDWGSNNAKIWKQYADERGWKCVLDEPVTTGGSDMSAQVLKIKQANPDVVNVSFYTPEMILFSKTMYNNKVNPKYGVWSVGGGSQDPKYLTGIDEKYYEYNFVQEDWDVGGPLREDWIKEMAAKVLKEKGYQLNSFFAQGWTAAYVAYAAIEAAGSTDKEKIKEALKTLDIKKGDGSRVDMTGYPEIKFDEKGQNTFSSGTIIQYQKGVAVPLSPVANRLEGSKAIVPIPDDFATRGVKK